MYFEWDIKPRSWLLTPGTLNNQNQMAIPKRVMYLLRIISIRTRFSPPTFYMASYVPSLTLSHDTIPKSIYNVDKRGGYRAGFYMYSHFFFSFHVQYGWLNRGLLPLMQMTDQPSPCIAPKKYRIVKYRNGMCHQWEIHCFSKELALPSLLHWFAGLLSYSCKTELIQNEETDKKACGICWLVFLSLMWLHYIYALEGRKVDHQGKKK